MSISDLLKERQSQYGFDLGIVLDAKGNVLGRSDQTEAFRESLADDPLVRPAIAKAAPFSGYWRQGDKLYQAAIMPLQQDQNLVGFVLLAQTRQRRTVSPGREDQRRADRVLAAVGRSSSATRQDPVRPGALCRGHGWPRGRSSAEQTPAAGASSLDESTAKALQDAVAARARR